jgi:hypothetical protein
MVIIPEGTIHHTMLKVNYLLGLRDMKPNFGISLSFLKCIV